jgi:H+/Cl- antiporter ClcA
MLSPVFQISTSICHQIMIYRSIINYSILSTVSFISLAASYGILAHVFHQTHPIATLYRMYEYHNEQPFQYIAIIAIVFGIFGALWIKYFGRSQGWKRWSMMTVVMIATIVGSSPIGGILWHIHDMQHGFIPAGIVSKIVEGAIGGLIIGWLIVLLSMPLNLIGVVIGYISLHLLSKSPKNSR